uniref:SH3 domain-containing protein n=1 Tax=Strigamia maritima TaxID=126957 RepID=T1JH42_STRMM
MAINLEKNKETLLSMWDDVVSDKTNTDWALFGYEGKSFDLKVVTKGVLKVQYKSNKIILNLFLDNGLEGLTEYFSSGKIMYAFCKVLDPNTSLAKFVLINWQGEAAPLEKKSKCANHFNDVKRFFKGAHVTINARTEDDVDGKLIIDKVAKSTASAFNFKERSKPDIDAKKPVGSVYKRIIPTAEINAVERDKFWEKEELEEKKRLEVEHKKVEDVKRKLDEERKIRELEEAQQREEMVKQRMRSISEIREAEKRNASNDPERVKWERQLQEDQQDESERRYRSESLRNQRKQEAEELIGKRNINARAIFEQNSAAGQMRGYRETNGRKTSSPEINPLPRPDVIPTTPPPDTSLPEPTVVNDLLKSGLPKRQHDSDDEKGEREWETPAVEVHSVQENAQVNIGEEFAQSVVSEGQGICARALYDYQAADETEISFDPDDIILHIDQIDVGWWQGMAPNGTYGLFPANYVELLE